MRHILCVTPYYTPFVGGTTTLVEAIARRLTLDHGRATVLTTVARFPADFWYPRAEPPLPGHEVLSGVVVERLPIAYPWPAPYTFGLLRRAGHRLHRSSLPLALQRPLLRRLARWMPPLPDLQPALDRLMPEADVVHAFDSSWDGLFTAAAHAARRYARPFVATPLMHLGDARVRAHFQMVHQVDAYRQADAIVALSRAEAAGYTRLGVASERVHVIPPGIDPPACVHDAEAAAAFRQEHHLVGSVVAFLGANTYDKGAFTLALAVAELNRTGAPVMAVFAGPASTELTAFLARQSPAVRTALEGRVHILGVVDEATKHRLLAACDMLALPSQVDTFGIVLLEAWSHGKPVIGAAAGGIPEVIRDGLTGLLVPFGDVDALAGAIRRLVEAPAWAQKLGEAGRELVLREYTWERTYRELTRVYAEVSARRSGRAIHE
ncbi:MAG: glycosyltransferase family 4 protein [Anaerolineae bacterium]